MEEKYILTLDIGTSTIRSFIYNSNAEIVGKASNQVVLQYPSHGYVEIDPDLLLSSIVQVVLNSMKDASLSPGQITAMGISTQRSTFITWSKATGKPFHNFITWKDLRADNLVKQWNKSFIWKLFKAGSYTLYLLLRSRRFKAGSSLKLMNSQTTVRFSWALLNNAALRSAVENHDAMFGTLDTWLLYKLTGGKVHMTDASSASATGFFDPFTMQWAGWCTRLFHIPSEALPPVVDTAGGHFTETDEAIWGHAIPIRCCIHAETHASGGSIEVLEHPTEILQRLRHYNYIVGKSKMADQTAAMWGACCFDEGDVKLTMGTGTFFNIHTGDVPHASASGLYPVVGWRLGTEIVYVAEGSNHDTASIIKWAQKLGLFENPEDSADIANSVADSDGVCFIPAFSGLGAPYNDGTAATGFVGMKPTTTKAHLVRAVLESLAFRTVQLFRCAREETDFRFHTISLDGGVSNNDFIAQLVADLTGLVVERPVNIEMSSLGCAHIIGLQLGIWKSKQKLKSLRKIGCVFHPRPSVHKAYEVTMAHWEEAVQRLCGWYTGKKSSQSLSSITDSSGALTRSGFKIPPERNHSSK